MAAREQPEDLKIMTAIRSFASHLVAGTAALALSFAMIGTTVSNPTAPTAPTVQEIMA
jgi:hypothetical protein